MRSSKSHQIYPNLIFFLQNKLSNTSSPPHVCSVGHTPEAGHFGDTGIESVWTQPWKTVGAVECSPGAMMQGGRGQERFAGGGDTKP